MRLLIGLGMALIVAIGAYVSFASRPPPTFAETSIQSRFFATTGLVKAGERLVAVGELGHILLSEDQGKTWFEAQIKDGRGSALTQVVFFNDKEGVAVGHDAWVLFTEDGGLNWRETLFDAEYSEPLLGVWGAAEGPVYAYGSFGRFFVSNDHGRSWEAREPGIEDAHVYAMDGDVDGHLMMVGEHGLAFKSTNFGQSWQAIPEFYRGTMFGLIRLNAEEWLAYGLRGNIFRTADFGKTWTNIPTRRSVGLFGHAVLPDGRIMIVGQGGLVLESRDNGLNFSVIQENKGGNLTAMLALADGKLLIGGLDGIHDFDADQQREQK